MLGLGWTEMLVIGIVALIVIGPKDLPDLMHKIGRFAGQVRRMGQDFQRELNKTTGLNEITNLRNTITQPLKATTDAIRREFNTTTASGAVEPSGAIKPADPKAESIVNELHAAAGMTPPKPAEPVPTLAEAMKEAIKRSVANAPTVAAAPVAAAAASTPAPKKRATKPKAEAQPSDAVPAKPKATPRKAAAKPVESPAPIEAIAPPVAKPQRKRTPRPASAVAPQAEAAAPPEAVAPKPRRTRKPASTSEA